MPSKRITLAPSGPVYPLLIVAGLAATILWSYWPALGNMAHKWWSDPQYSHAYLVPIFAGGLLWWRRSQLTKAAPQPSWWGAPLLLLGLVLRLAGTWYYFDWLEAVSLLPLLAGAALLFGGWPALRWSWLAIGFLFFMMPLPHRLETGLAQPLQRIATLGGTYALQTLGRPALSEGNIIIINQTRIGVVEACNGLGMLLVFFAIATAVALLIQRSLLDKFFILVSAAPVAVIVNVIRITVTGILHETVGSRWADLVFHDLAGWLMMPLALGILAFELHVLSRLFVDVAPAHHVPPVGLGRAFPTATPPRKKPDKAPRRPGVPLPTIGRKGLK